MPRQTKRLVICLDDAGYEASVEGRKIYVSSPDSRAEKLGMLRVVDESGEDYLYDRHSFKAVTLPQALRRAVLLAAE